MGMRRHFSRFARNCCASGPPRELCNCASTATNRNKVAAISWPVRLVQSILQARACTQPPARTPGVPITPTERRTRGQNVPTQSRNRRDVGAPAQCKCMCSDCFNAHLAHAHTKSQYPAPENFFLSARDERSFFHKTVHRAFLCQRANEAPRVISPELWVENPLN